MTAAQPGADLPMGIHPGMPEDQYHAAPGLGSTAINALHKSPAWYRWITDNPQPATPAMTRGSALHSLVLGGPAVGVNDPDTGDTYPIAITDDDVPLVAGMTRAVRNHRRARALIDGAQHECSAFRIVETAFGPVVIKGRYDALHDGLLVVDLKKAGKGADPRAFGRSAADFGYFRQGGLYHLVGGFEIGDVPYYLVVVEEKPPHFVAVYELHPDDLRTGQTEALAAIEAYARAVATGVWPGPVWADDDPDTAPPYLRLPTWYRSHEETA